MKFIEKTSDGYVDIYVDEKSYNVNYINCNRDDRNLYDNTLAYYKGYLLHNDIGPAIDKYNNMDNENIINIEKRWYKNGLQHRDNGPAIEMITLPFYYKYNEWWLNNKQYSEEQYWKMVNFKNKNRVLYDI